MPSTASNPQVDSGPKNWRNLNLQPQGPLPIRDAYVLHEDRVAICSLAASSPSLNGRCAPNCEAHPGVACCCVEAGKGALG